MNSDRLPFSFSGTIPPSKSLLIRGLLLQLTEPAVTLPVLSRCSDVVAMQGACAAFAAGQTRIHCGEAGLVLRLCLGYAARRGGDFVLCGSRRLIERPHEPFLSVLRQLGAQVSVCDDGAAPALRTWSLGFADPGGRLSLLSGLSSQFASSLILNAWDLPFPLHILCEKEPISEGYLDLSIDVAQRCGMQIERQYEADKMILIVPPRQRLVPAVLPCEADVSSAFAVAALAAVAGTCHIVNFPLHSLQPDHCFVDILQKMGVSLDLSTKGLVVQRAERLRAIEVDVGGAPDLTPVLSVLCALAEGTSRLFGAPHLRGKESDRIATTSALLQVLGREHTPREDGIEIVGRPLADSDRSTLRQFDAGSDHRLVMAAALARWAGFPVEIAGLSAVHKSFPEFLTIAGLADLAADTLSEKDS